MYFYEFLSLKLLITLVNDMTLSHKVLKSHNHEKLYPILYGITLLQRLFELLLIGFFPPHKNQ